MQGTRFFHSKWQIWAMVLLAGGLWTLAGCGKKSDYAVEETSEFVKVEEPAAAKTAYYEHFEKNQAGEYDKPGQPAGWWDESNDAAHNAEIEVTGQGAARITKVSDDVWGKVLSDKLTLDLDASGQLRIVIVKVDKNTGFKVMVQEPDQQEIQVSEPGDGAGVHTYDIKSKTGWSGVKTFSVVLVVEAVTNGVGTTVDELWITPPIKRDAYQAHFNGLAGQPGGWWDYTNEAGNNAEIDNSGSGSAKVFKAGKDVWGKVLSDRLKMDVDLYPTLSIIVTQIDENAGFKVMLLEQGTSQALELSDPQTEAGTHRYNIPAKTGWSGEKIFSIMLVVEAKNNRLGARIDEIRIDEAGF